MILCDLGNESIQCLNLGILKAHLFHRIVHWQNALQNESGGAGNVP